MDRGVYILRALAEEYGLLISVPCACGTTTWLVRCAFVGAQHAAQSLPTPIIILFFFTDFFLSGHTEM